MTRHDVRAAELDALLQRLLTVHDAEPVVLSMYLTVPVDPAEGIRAVTAKLHGLLTDVQARVDVEQDKGRRKQLAADLDAARSALVTQAPAWLGHGVAVFAASTHDLFAVQRLPEAVADCACLGTRPHLRPLLTARRRTVPYCAVVVDRRHSWLYLPGEDGLGLATRLDGESERASSFGGWHGLDEQRARRHAAQLAHNHYLATSAALLDELGAGRYDRLVVGGHVEGTAEFAATLPAQLHDRLAGTFVIDPHTMTAALVSEHADRVVADWVDARQSRLVADLAAFPDRALVAEGLDPCLTAASQHAVELLAVPDDLSASGVECEACGALGVTAGDCRVCGAATHAVPDLVDELVAQVLEDGGTAELVPAATGPVARLRHPVVGV